METPDIDALVDSAEAPSGFSAAETAPRNGHTTGTHLPEELNLRHREIIRLAFSGLAATAIAEQVGMALSTVRMILRSPLAQAEIARLHDRADESVTNVPMKVRLLNELTKAGTDALQINGELMRDKTVDPRVRAGIGRHFLDRIVFGQNDTDREGGYREILRGIDRLERQLDPNVVLIRPGQVQSARSEPPEGTLG